MQIFYITPTKMSSSHYCIYKFRCKRSNSDLFLFIHFSLPFFAPIWNHFCYILTPSPLKNFSVNYLCIYHIFMFSWVLLVAQ